MGVLACDRRGCDNIMCEHYSYEWGYLCCDCLQELIDKGPTKFGEFMSTPKFVEKSSEGWGVYVKSKFQSQYED